MQEVFEKVIERLEELHERYIKQYGVVGGNPMAFAVKECIDIVELIVNQEAEKFGTDTNVGSNGWILISERLPDEAFGCLVTVMDCEPSTQTDFENILPYFVGYDSQSWNNADGEEIPFEVIAWKKLPTPYHSKGE